MKIYLDSAYTKHATLDVVRKLVKIDSVRSHRVCDSPDDADIILFVENAHFDDYLFRRLRSHPLIKKYPHKVYMFNEVDKPWAVLPGLYASMPKRFFQENRQTSFAYFSTPNDFVKHIYTQHAVAEREWLFSFVGAQSHRCRKPVMELSSATPSVQDTSDFNVWHCTDDTKAIQGRNYAGIMAKSHFVLCPRGIGTSSFRLFESMEAGRAPVIISNQWVAPDFIDWDFAVRVPENQIHKLPSYLASIKDEAKERGEAARAAWARHFSPNTIFNTAADALEQLKDVRTSTARKVYFQNARKVYIENEVRLLAHGRRIRDRLNGLAAGNIQTDSSL